MKRHSINLELARKSKQAEPLVLAGGGARLILCGEAVSSVAISTVVGIVVIDGNSRAAVAGPHWFRPDRPLDGRRGNHSGRTGA